jgi:hypothetical protein
MHAIETIGTRVAPFLRDGPADDGIADTTSLAGTTGPADAETLEGGTQHGSATRR